MMPSSATMQEHMKALEVGLDSEVVCYDGQSMEWASRASQVLVSFGHKNVFILNGGLKQWLQTVTEVVNV
jgi:thiosulfate/3-mercaptopyruvate sulfurtransferase